MYKCYRLPENLNTVIDKIISELSYEPKGISTLFGYYMHEIEGKTNFENNVKQLISFYEDNIINADEISKENFPIEKVDVFISHAHKDKELAYKLASLLEALGLKCFIDSCVWENVNDLIKNFESEYPCILQTENHDKRNIMTSHAHLMLASALVEMINRCECFFFIDTENSTYNEKSNSFDAMTLSPWIKLEIDTARIITRKQPRRKLYEKFSSYGTESFKSDIPKFLYPLSMRHLIKLEEDQFTYWIKRSCASKGVNHPLDELYIHGE